MAAAWGTGVRGLQELGWTIASAGTSGLPGGPASEHSCATGAEIGLDLSGHRSRNLEQLSHLRWDLVLGMSRAHLAALPPDLQSRAELFDPAGAEVPDPYGGSLAAYRSVRDQLQQAVAERLRAWSAWPEAGA
ncbi:MAG: hypothetical protein H8E31_14765 [Planctomycetes bacterium]|nr:hypothetical protein [Planctomycetota bacterium]